MLLACSGTHVGKEAASAQDEGEALSTPEEGQVIGRDLKSSGKAEVAAKLLQLTAP